MAGAFVAVGDAAGWATATALTGAFAVCGAVAALGALASGRLPSRL